MKKHIEKVLYVIKSKEFIVRFLIIIIISAGIIFNNYQIYFFLASGVLLGSYYGWNNDMIWRPDGKLEKSYPYRAHQIWIHIICGIVSSIALYFLINALDFNNKNLTIYRLGVTEFVLLIIVLMGYVGLLPRILWFFSYAQQNMFSSK